MEVVGVIPARGGSAGIHRKNLAELAGRPLISYTCDAARASTRLTRALVSTDDDEIAAVAEAHGVEAPFRRPAELARAETPMLPVLLHALDWLAAERGLSADVVVLLQPTSPLRRAEHVDAAVELLDRTRADAVVSVVEVPHNFTPGSLLELHADGSVTQLHPEAPLRRQEKPLLYARNGPAVYAGRVATLRERAGLYDGRTVAYEMALDESIDVDGEDDLALCEVILSARR